jgi:hypothetical protein
MAMGKVIAGIIKAAKNQGKQPNFGVVKTKLEKKIREGTATKEDRSLLREIRNKDAAATKSQKIKQSQASRKTPVSLAGSSKVGGTQSKLKQGLASVKDTPNPKVKKPTKKPTSAAKKKRMEEAKKKGSGALMREGLSDVVNKKKYGSKVTKKAAGGPAAAAMAHMEARKQRRKQAAKDLGTKVLKRGGTPKGVGCATRGYGKAMR